MIWVKTLIIRKNRRDKFLSFSHWNMVKTWPISLKGVQKGPRVERKKNTSNKAYLLIENPTFNIEVYQAFFCIYFQEEKWPITRKVFFKPEVTRQKSLNNLWTEVRINFFPRKHRFVCSYGNFFSVCLYVTTRFWKLFWQCVAEWHCFILSLTFFKKAA